MRTTFLSGAPISTGRLPVRFLKFIRHASRDSIRVCFIGARGVRDSLTASSVDKKIGARAIAIAELPG